MIKFPRKPITVTVPEGLIRFKALSLKGLKSKLPESIQQLKINRPQTSTLKGAGLLVGGILLGSAGVLDIQEMTAFNRHPVQNSGAFPPGTAIFAEYRKSADDDTTAPIFHDLGYRTQNYCMVTVQEPGRDSYKIVVSHAHYFKSGLDFVSASGSDEKMEAQTNGDQNQVAFFAAVPRYQEAVRFCLKTEPEAPAVGKNTDFIKTPTSFPAGPLPVKPDNSLPPVWPWGSGIT